eukprot:TRINITY_DN55067_c0_g1_i1.p1 TRINITY_DN55067_c0_g1~~TRINITY_DN55067_c0_g1_i1.p1  ORF type:complete len:606 (-),score=93.80 TRINITY_DN55067_c0_g1_i1:198-2015(-)
MSTGSSAQGSSQLASAEDAQKFKDAFEAHARGDGTIGQEELGQILRDLGKDLTEADSEMVAQICKNNDGRITHSELVQAMFGKAMMSAFGAMMMALQDEEEEELTEDVLTALKNHRKKKEEGKSSREQNADNMNLMDVLLLLLKSNCMKHIPRDRLPQVALACEAVEFNVGSEITGCDSEDGIFFVRSGSVSEISGSTSEVLDADSCFGPLGRKPSAAVYRAISTVSCFHASRTAIARYGGGTLVKLLEDAIDAGGASEKGEPETIALDKLKTVGLLGTGGFGYVELAEHEETTKQCAVKTIHKGYIVKTGSQEGMLNERRINMVVHSPFIVKMYASVRHVQFLALVLEPCLGGELYATYKKKKFHGSERHAKYYIASVALAFEHLHERHVVWRDAKPENSVLDGRGHLKIIDLQLAKFIRERTYTTCGTPDYMAPEVVSSEGHNWGFDWWQLAILLFELLNGEPPFSAAFPMQIYKKIEQGIEAVTFPKSCKGAARALVEALLIQEPEMRLPMKSGGVKNLKQHSFFDGFDWARLEDGSMEPPYKPEKPGLSKFSANENNKPKQIGFTDTGSDWDAEFDECIKISAMTHWPLTPPQDSSCCTMT